MWKGHPPLSNINIALQLFNTHNPFRFCLGGQQTNGKLIVAEDKRPPA